MRGRSISAFLIASIALALFSSGVVEAQEELFPPQFAFAYVYGRHPGAGIGLDPAGNVWVADDLAGLFFVLDPYLVTSSTWAGVGTPVGAFLNPVDIAFASTGDFFVLESSRVRRFDAARNPLGTFGSAGSGPGQFLSPTHIVCDTQGNVYVSDGPAGRVQKFNSTGALLQEWDLPVGPQTPSAAGVFVDAANRVFVTDAGNRKVVVFSSSGSVLTSWGETGSGPGQLLAPGAIAVDAVGIVYVADLATLRVQKFLIGGTPLTYWRPSLSSSPPSDIATGPLGRIYVDGHGSGGPPPYAWIQGLQYEATLTRTASWGAVKRLYR